MTGGDDFEARRWKEQVRHGLLGGTPTRIGPYELQGQIGRGGMGLVYRGYDPRLDRAVAIKVLRRVGAEQERRLREEARTLAELDHPNIVRVFDVGVFEGRVFVVMPLLEGLTVGQWTRSSLTNHARMEVLLRAGRGIAAAHEAGVLHRDIKPANIIVDPGGWPVVLDFGLGKALAAPTSRTEETGTSSTAAGGTPGYVAPEQAAGETVDERADVFGFCVTVLECISQRAPVPSHGPACSVEELDALLASVPRRWRKVLRAGVEQEPRQRPRTMEAVLRALERTPTRGRWWVAGGVAAFAGALAWPSGTDISARAATEPKPDLGAAPSVSVLLAASRQKVGAGAVRDAKVLARQAVVAAQKLGDQVGLAEGLALRGRLLSRLDDHEAALSDLEDAYAIARSQGRPELEFDSALALVDAFCALRRGARAQIWLRHARALRSRVESRGAQARWALAASRTARVLGSLDEAARHISEAEIDDADAALQVAILGQKGNIEVLRGDSQQAVATLSLALHQARELWGPGDPRTGRMLADLGAAHLRHGAVEPAAEALDEAVRLLELSLGTEHPRFAMAVQNRAIVQWRRGDLEGAIASYRLGVQSFEAAWGPEHPEVAHARENLSTALIYAGDYDGALRQQNRALVIRESALGSEHPSVARTLNYIAQSHEALGQWKLANDAARRAHELALEVLGRKNSTTAETAAARSRISIGQGRFSEARGFAEDAIDIYRSIGAGPLELGSAHESLALALCGAPPIRCPRGTDERRKAEAAASRARELYTQAGLVAAASQDVLESWAGELLAAATKSGKPRTTNQKASTDTQD
ncbi:MAG: protein kinase domain-containing protein [Nannocystales bacterium]